MTEKKTGRRKIIECSPISERGIYIDIWILSCGVKIMNQSTCAIYFPLPLILFLLTSQGQAMLAA